MVKFTIADEKGLHVKGTALYLGGSFENPFELLASLSKHPMIVDILCVDSFDYLQLLTFSEWPKTL